MRGSVRRRVRAFQAGGGGEVVQAGGHNVSAGLARKNDHREFPLPFDFGSTMKLTRKGRANGSHWKRCGLRRAERLLLLSAVERWQPLGNSSALGATSSAG